MGKIILEFDSNEEKEEAKTALNAEDWKNSVWEMDQYLRDITKYLNFENRPATEQEIHLAETMRADLREILNNNGLTI